jgi:AcrR family transcriptional regulator
MSRPRDDHLDEAIDAATLSLLVEVGYEGVTIAEVARRASTVPPTIYRRHRNVRELILATLRREFAEVGDHEVPDLGELRAELLVYVREIIAGLTPARVAILTGLLLPLRRDPHLASAVRMELGTLRAGGWEVTIARAVSRGELADRAENLAVLGRTAPAVILHRLMLLNLPANDGFVDELVDTVLLPGLKTAAAGRSRRTSRRRKVT